MKLIHGMESAVREHLLQGQPITRLEALIFFGVSNLTGTISALRKQGFIIKSKSVLQPPAALPAREILLTEYWISK